MQFFRSTSDQEAEGQQIDFQIVNVRGYEKTSRLPRVIRYKRRQGFCAFSSYAEEQISAGTSNYAMVEKIAPDKIFPDLHNCEKVQKLVYPLQSDHPPLWSFLNLSIEDTLLPQVKTTEQ